MRAQFSAVRFRDPAQAEANLARLEPRLAPALLAPLGSLLAQSPDPDGALDLLERYAQAAGPEALCEIERLPSALADVVLTNALLYCDLELEKRHGQPQYRDPQGRIARAGFSIVSLGKLGGNELDYSSDIDLLFLYSHDGETAGGTERGSLISNKEYAVRLSRAITRAITEATPYGSVFRVGLRLRPEGEQGDLAISVKSALAFYEHRARRRELGMIIQARHS